METYCENIEGTFVEERNSTVVWNFKNAEEEHGSQFAKELYLQIKELLGPKSYVEIIQGKGFIEVKPIKLKKEKLIKQWLNDMDIGANKIDFLLYIGNDSPTNDEVFEYLLQDHRKYFSDDCPKYVCAYERKVSKAKYCIEEQEILLHLIRKLVEMTKRRKKSRSYSNLIQKTPIELKKSNLNKGRGDVSTNNLPGLISSAGMFNKPTSRDNRATFIDNLYVPIAETPACEEESTYKAFSVDNEEQLSIKKEGSWVSSLKKTVKGSNSDKDMVFNQNNNLGFLKAASMDKQMTTDRIEGEGNETDLPFNKGKSNVTSVPTHFD